MKAGANSPSSSTGRERTAGREGGGGKEGEKVEKERRGKRGELTLREQSGRMKGRRSRRKSEVL